MAWSVFVVVSLMSAAIAVYMPVIGGRVASVCLLPARINAIPQLPLVRLAIDIMRLPRPQDNQEDLVRVTARKGEN